MHEQRPSTLKMSKFNETLDLLSSASAWTKFNLERFGVLFERTVYTELSSLVGLEKWYDYSGERPGFMDSMILLGKRGDRRIQ